MRDAANHAGAAPGWTGLRAPGPGGGQGGAGAQGRRFQQMVDIDRVAAKADGAVGQRFPVLGRDQPDLLGKVPGGAGAEPLSRR